jgi:hypothetical protein
MKIVITIISSILQVPSSIIEGYYSKALGKIRILDFWKERGAIYIKRGKPLLF